MLVNEGQEQRQIICSVAVYARVSSVENRSHLDADTLTTYYCDLHF